MATEYLNGHINGESEIQQLQTKSSNSLNLNPSPSLRLSERLGRSKSSQFQRFKKQLYTRGKLYEDPNFGADGSSLYYSRATPRNIEWRRPHEILKDPKFVTGGSVRFDVDQHDMGDCWYLAALATLATRPALLETVVPMDQTFDTQYAGIFEFYFWRFGKWEQVIVDDRLPFNTTRGRLAFCHNRDEPNEFWSALCEKAYAKCFGSYEALDGGLPQDALVDMTGAIGEMVILKDEVKDQEELWQTMMKSNDLEFGPLLTAGIFAPRNSTSEQEVALETGLYARHAYSVTAVQEVDVKANHPSLTEVRLVRVRNPWGDRHEWKGDWSDKSIKWNLVPEDIRKSLDLKVAPDGEFWISFKDFVANFDALMLGHLTPSTLSGIMFSRSRQHILDRSKFNWSEKSMYGEWVRGATAGGRDRLFMNPQFRVELKPLPGFSSVAGAGCPLVVSLTQMKRRLMRTLTRRDQNELPIAFFLFKPKSNVVKKSYSSDELEHVGGSVSFVYEREVAKTLFLEPGVYVVIPCTYYADMEGEFLVRFMTLTGSVRPMDEDTDPVAPVPKSETQLLDELYMKFSGGDLFIDAFELHQILKELLSGVLNVTSFSRSTCVRILECFDHSGDKRLNRFEVKQIWDSMKLYHSTFQQFDRNQDGFFDTSELPKGFEHLKISTSRRVRTVLVKMYGTRRGLMDLEGFVMAIVALLIYSRKWLSSKDYAFGRVTFEQFLLWELNNEIPDVDDQDEEGSGEDGCVIL